MARTLGQRRDLIGNAGLAVAVLSCILSLIGLATIEISIHRLHDALPIIGTGVAIAHIGLAGAFLACCLSVYSATGKLRIVFALTAIGLLLIAGHYGVPVVREYYFGR